MAFLSIFMLLLVIVPALVGVVLIVSSRRKGQGFPACGGCGYDVTGTIGTTARCPECGADLKQVGVLPSVTRRNPMLLWAGIALVVLPTACFGSVMAISMLSYYEAAAQRSAAQRAAAQAAQAQAAASTQPQPQPPPTQTSPGAGR